MNCNQTREAIDSSSRRAAYGDSVNAHLSGCSDCRHNADETESLLMLLKDLPRAEAPSGFESDVIRRIRKYEAEQVSSTGFFERLRENFLQTFSFGQAATAMAAAAVLITVSTFYVRQDNGGAVAPRSADVAVVNPAPAPLKSKVEVPSEVKPVEPAPVRATTVKFTSRSVKATPAAAVETASVTDIASADNMPRFYSRETRQVVQDRNAFGAELISSNTAKSAAPALSF